MKKLDIYDYDFMKWCEDTLEDENYGKHDRDYWFNQMADNKDWAEENWKIYLGEKENGK